MRTARFPTRSGRYPLTAPSIDRFLAGPEGPADRAYRRRPTVVGGPDGVALGAGRARPLRGATDAVGVLHSTAAVRHGGDARASSEVRRYEILVGSALPDTRAPTNGRGTTWGRFHLPLLVPDPQHARQPPELLEVVLAVGDSACAGRASGCPPARGRAPESPPPTGSPNPRCSRSLARHATPGAPAKAAGSAISCASSPA